MNHVGFSKYRRPWMDSVHLSPKGLIRGYFKLSAWLALAGCLAWLFLR